MLDLLLVQRFLIALALGALIGLEREYARYRQRGHDYAGIRTFPLIALFGALAAYLGTTISVYILLLSMLLLGLLIIVAYLKTADRMHSGATSEMAGLLTFFIGLLVYYEEFTFAILLAVVITLILYGRSVLHQFARKMKEKELTATLKFAVIAFVILPFLPNQSYGPLGLFNPFLIWLMVIFISGISFIGYILLKWFGEKGIVLTGLLGGLASSTATASSFAEKSRVQRRIYHALALGVIAANGVMFLRTLLEVFVLNRSLFVSLAFPLLILAAVTAVFSVFFWRRIKNVPGKMELGSPFTVKPALKFALIFAAVIALVKFADAYLSSEGVYVVSFFSGFADVDAITVSLAQLAKGSLQQETARNGVMIAALTNTAVKGAIAWWLGGKEFRKIVLWFFGVLVVLGLVLMVLL